MPFDPVQLRSEEVSRRHHWLLTLMLVLAGPAFLTMADLHWRTGFDAWKLLHLALFAVLFVLVALGAAQSLIGFGIRRKGGDPCIITRTIDPPDLEETISARTAIVMPICNEEVGRVIEGIRVIYESLVRNGRLASFDLFLLSDSTDPACWIAEEAAWLALTRELGAHGRIFYRKRRQGINKKAGNLADFCRRWGKAYRYMVVLDADSLMTGDAIFRLVQLMEHNRRVGIIQGVPLLVNGETVLARLQQFASRLYGPVSASGLNFWQLGEANYWGHNAIIRLAPFMRHCSLPGLPGDGPFGGRILSHDYVEAALMRRAGWEVWLATDLEGNYEECPPTVVDLAARDRRWLQGNLQHARLIFAKGIHMANRIHFVLGILSYLASPLWLAFLVISAVIASRLKSVSLPEGGFSSYTHWSYSGEALVLFGYTMALLFLPKVLALLDLRSRPAAVGSFGGWGRLAGGVVLETLIFTLLAPVLMVFHSWYILLTLAGRKVSWGTQRRGQQEDPGLAEVVRAHAAQTILGLVGVLAISRIDPATFPMDVADLRGTHPFGASVLFYRGVGRRSRAEAHRHIPDSRGEQSSPGALPACGCDGEQVPQGGVAAEPRSAVQNSPGDPGSLCQRGARVAPALEGGSGAGQGTIVSSRCGPRSFGTAWRRWIPTTRRRFSWMQSRCTCSTMRCGERRRLCFRNRGRLRSSTMKGLALRR